MSAESLPCIQESVCMRASGGVQTQTTHVCAHTHLMCMYTDTRAHRYRYMTDTCTDTCVHTCSQTQTHPHLDTHTHIHVESPGRGLTGNGWGDHLTWAVSCVCHGWR